MPILALFTGDIDKSQYEALRKEVGWEKNHAVGRDHSCGRRRRRRQNARRGRLGITGGVERIRSEQTPTRHDEAAVTNAQRRSVPRS